jgi:hypothetical protein
MVRQGDLVIVTKLDRFSRDIGLPSLLCATPSARRAFLSLAERFDTSTPEGEPQMMLRPLLAASAVLLVALPARAERPNDAVTLEYLPSRATVALCPAAGFLALEVQIRLGYELFQPSAPNHLTVKIDRANGRFRSIGEMRDDDGKVIFARTYSEIDCTQALVSMAISVSVKFTRPPEDPEPSPPGASASAARRYAAPASARIGATCARRRGRGN